MCAQDNLDFEWRTFTFTTVIELHASQEDWAENHLGSKIIRKKMKQKNQQNYFEEHSS